jgi:hypothetical protein
MRLVRVVLGLALGVLALSPTAAAADATYPSQHIELHPVADAPLITGFVENIHANGPNVFAHEVYVLAGATPNTAYDVSIDVYVQDPSCSSTPITFTTATLTTSAGGSGKAEAFFSPEAAAALRHATHGAVWTLSVDGTPVYQTGCSTIVLD